MTIASNGNILLSARRNRGAAAQQAHCYPSVSQRQRRHARLMAKLLIEHLGGRLSPGGQPSAADVDALLSSPVENRQREPSRRRKDTHKARQH
jgi:hypothetical protein